MRWDPSTGQLFVGHWRGTPVFASWTLPLGMLFFGRTLVGGAAITFVILAHEIGHAILIRRRRLTPVRITLHGFGGECAFDGERATPFDRAIIAWGGVLAQAVILGCALAVQAVLGPPVTPSGAQLYRALIDTNVFMIVLNLLPIPILDGYRAWQLVPLGWAWAKSRAARRREGDRLRRAAVERAAHRGLRVVEDDDPPPDRTLH